MIEIKERRKDMKLTQMELSKLSGVSQSKISCCERGIQSVSIASAKRLAKVFGINWTEFFQDEEAENANADNQRGR